MKTPRMSGLLLISLVLVGIVLALSPQQLPISVYKLSLIAVAAWFGYWIDRALFPYARPHLFVADPNHLAPIRRAIIIAACIIGVALGA